jgi:hypothetical protein
VPERPPLHAFGTPAAEPAPSAPAPEPEPPAEPEPVHAFDAPAAEPAPPEPQPFGPPPTFAAEPAPYEPPADHTVDAEAAAAPEPEPEPEPVVDLDALHGARELMASLRATIEELGVTAARITTEAHAVVDDHGRTLRRLDRAAEAAARAEQAAVEAGRLASTVVIDAGPFADAAAVRALRDALAAQPGARDAYVRGVEDGRAVIEVHLAPPSA